MKNMMAVVLAGLLAVSTAASMPPAISESLPAGSSSEMSISESLVPESDSVPEQAETASAENAQENANSSESVEGMPPNSQTNTKAPLPPESGSGEPAGEEAPESPPPAKAEKTEDDTPEAEASDTSERDEAVSPSSKAEEADADSMGPEESQGTEVQDEGVQPKEAIARFGETLCRDLADEQAGSLMGHYGLERSTACTTAVTALALADYALSDDLDRNYAMVWAALQSSVEALAADGHTAANCTYADGTLTLWA